MPVHPRPLLAWPRHVAVLVLVLVLAGCAASASTSSPAPAPAPAAPDPAAGPTLDDRATDDRDPDDGGPYELVLTADTAGVPGDDSPAPQTRHVVVGDRRHVSIALGDDVGDAHIVTADEHWWWLHPSIRRAFDIDIEWIHIDIPAVDSIDGELPAVVAAARTLLPDPAEVEEGDIVAGREVLTLERLGPDEVRFTVADLDVAMVLRRRPLPADTTIDLPEGATDLRDLAGELGGG